IGAVITNLPLSFPRYASKSSSFSIFAYTTSAVTGPLVPDVHALGYAISGKCRGAISLASRSSFDQPRPNGPHGSSWTFASPQELSVLTVYSPASRIFGELVRRGPYTSVR